MFNGYSIVSQLNLFICLIEFKKIKEDFKKLINANKLSHAYLFFGGSSEDKSRTFCEFNAKGIFEKNNLQKVRDKFDFAVELAKYLEKESKVLQECLIIEPDEKNIIGIDAAKKINAFLYQKPVLSKKRTAIIKNAENMTAEAQNAVLKTVEEPPQDALIIFIAKSEDSLLVPLTSRLQKIYFAESQHKSVLNRHKSAPIEEIVENDKIDEYFETLIAELRKDPVKNIERLREALKRLSAIKMFNVNKKLQLKCLR